MSRWRPLAAIGMAAALLCLSGHAQEQEKQQEEKGQPQQTPVFREGINFVRVDVIVADKSGNPVNDLTRDDFTITEDGKPQTIEAFKFIDLDGGFGADPGDPPRPIRSDSDLEVEAARDDVRLFGIFLDDYHVRRGASMRAREELVRFVESQLGPTDIVGLMYPLQPASEIQFTRDLPRIASGLRSFTGRKYEYEPKNQFEANYANYPTETVERIRNEVSLSAINALILRMGALKEGRKALILVSEGYTYRVPPQLRSRIAGLPDPRNPARGDPTAGTDNIIEERAAMSSDADMQMDLQRLYGVANRHNVAIYTVDPRGLAGGEFGIDENIGLGTDRSMLDATTNTLRTLASETDGRAIVNQNNLAAGMRQVLRDSSAYYLLGYTTTQAATDGKFHEITVRVSRPGVQVRARKGYWALAPEEVERSVAAPKPQAPAAVTTALATLSQPSRGRYIRTWLGTDRGEDGRTKVTFLWEALPAVPGGRAEAADRPASVMLTATGESGSPYFRGRIPADASRVSFDAAPGPVQLRLSVEGASADVLDSEIRTVTIPDLASPRVTLATPRVFRARTVREMQDLKANDAAIPTAVREFSRTERLLVRVQAYGPGNAAPSLTARILNAAGQPMNDLTVDPDSTIEVLLSRLVAGDYVIEITAADGAENARELVAFRIS